MLFLDKRLSAPEQLLLLCEYAVDYADVTMCVTLLQLSIKYEVVISRSLAAAAPPQNGPEPRFDDMWGGHPSSQQAVSSSFSNPNSISVR